MNPVRGIVAALLPLLFALFAAFGITLSEDVKLLIQTNVEAILIALGLLGTVAPGIVAQIKKLKEEQQEPKE
jgi:hypothetical protein